MNGHQRNRLLRMSCLPTVRLLDFTCCVILDTDALRKVYGMISRGKIFLLPILLSWSVRSGRSLTLSIKRGMSMKLLSPKKSTTQRCRSIRRQRVTGSTISISLNSKQRRAKKEAEKEVVRTERPVTGFHCGLPL